jgi:branched-chain amino acid transport system permease protein
MTTNRRAGVIGFRTQVGLAALLALTAAIPALVGGRYIPSIFTSILLFFILGALFDFMLGYLSIVNFGIAGFLCAGAYASALSVKFLGISPWVGLLIGGVAALVLGVITGALTLRLRGIYVGLTTLFVMETLRFVISNSRDVTRGVSGLSVGIFPPIGDLTFQRSNPLAYYYVLLILVSITYACLHFIVYSKIGLVFRAIRDDDLGVSVLGLDIVRYKLLNFAVGSFFVGVFGAFYGNYIGILVPTPQEFGIERTVEILTIAYIGGRGTLWGSLLGAIALVGMQELLRDFNQWRLICYGSFLIVIILGFPGGLAGAVRDLTTKITQWRGIRHPIINPERYKP